MTPVEHDDNERSPLGAHDLATSSLQGITPGTSHIPNPQAQPTVPFQIHMKLGRASYRVPTRQCSYGGVAWQESCGTVLDKKAGVYSS